MEGVCPSSVEKAVVQATVSIPLVSDSKPPPCLASSPSHQSRLGPVGGPNWRFSLLISSWRQRRKQRYIRQSMTSVLRSVGLAMEAEKEVKLRELEVEAVRISAQKSRGEPAERSQAVSLSIKYKQNSNWAKLSSSMFTYAQPPAMPALGLSIMEVILCVYTQGWHTQLGRFIHRRKAS